MSSISEKLRVEAARLNALANEIEAEEKRMQSERDIDKRLSEAVCGNRSVADTSTRLERRDRIKAYAKKNRIRLWEVSEKMGYADSASFSRLLRNVSAEQELEILGIIDDLSAESAQEPAS